MRSRRSPSVGFQGDRSDWISVFLAFCLATITPARAIDHLAFGDEGNDRGVSVIQLHGGGYLVVGALSREETGEDGLVLRLDAKGEVLWHRVFGDRKSTFQSENRTQISNRFS